MGTANKTTAALLAGAVVTILTWALNTYAHAQIPDFVQGAASTLISALFVFFIPNKEAGS